MKFNLMWANNFSSKNKRSFSEAQKFVDSECVRFMNPYTPKQSDALIKSATLGTKIGSGRIEQTAPYARYQYYGKLMVSRTTGSAWAKQGESKVLTDKELTYSAAKNPQAGKMWFERMKSDKKEQILRGAKKILAKR